MVVGTTITKYDGNAYYSPSFSRGGLAGTFAIDVTHLYGSPTVTVTIQHRDEHDTTFADLGSFSAITATGSDQVDLTGIKQIVRFRYEFDAGDDATDAMHFIMQAPSWRPYP